MPVSYPCYWQKKDNSGYWYWIYYATNGKRSLGVAKATIIGAIATTQSRCCRRPGTILFSTRNRWTRARCSLAATGRTSFGPFLLSLCGPRSIARLAPRRPLLSAWTLRI